MGGAGIKACQLKGRRNYLCLRRFNAMRTTALSDEEAYLASRVLVWLGETETGDRAELRLSHEEETVWWRVSAEGAECSNDNSPYVVDGTCFLQRARKHAEASHLVVVNHALLLSDIGTGGRVVPPYEHVIIDEAHHLEDEATRQFGFACRQKELFELIERCDAIVPGLGNALRSSSVIMQARQELGAKASAVREAGKAAKPHVRTLCELLATFLVQHSPPGDEPKLHITRSQRAQPDWSDVEIAWDNAKASLGALAGALQKLYDDLQSAEQLGMLNHELVLAETGNCLNEVVMRVAGISQGIEADDPQRIVWIETDRFDGGVVVSWVPLDVADLLRAGLYADRKTVILTGATLRTQGGFTYLQQRLGLDDSQTLALGSPFDFRRASLVLVPRDMPEPNSPLYLDALGRAIVDLTRASEGRALVLFTSHSQLRAAHWLVQSNLREEGITALAQGVDGSPRQLVRAAQGRPEDGHPRHVELLGGRRHPRPPPLADHHGAPAVRRPDGPGTRRPRRDVRGLVQPVLAPAGGHPLQAGLRTPDPHSHRPRRPRRPRSADRRQAVRPGVPRGPARLPRPHDDDARDARHDRRIPRPGVASTTHALGRSCPTVGANGVRPHPPRASPSVR